MATPQHTLHDSMASAPSGTGAAPQSSATFGVLQCFPIFPDLPIEIRLMIWELHGGRTLPIVPGQAHTDSFYCLPHAVPALFSVNQEARGAAKKTHTLIDLTPNNQSSDASTPAAVERRSVWVDFTKDVFYLIQPESQGYSLSPHCILFLREKIPALQSIRHFAIGEEFYENAVEFCNALPAIQSLTFIQNSCLGSITTVAGGRCVMQGDTKGIYLVKSAIDNIWARGVDRFELFYMWTEMWRSSGSPINTRVRLCDLIQDEDRRDEKLESWDGLRDAASITLADFA